MRSLPLRPHAVEASLRYGNLTCKALFIWGFISLIDTVISPVWPAHLRVITRQDSIPSGHVVVSRALTQVRLTLDQVLGARARVCRPLAVAHRHAIGTVAALQGVPMGVERVHAGATSLYGTESWCAMADSTRGETTPVSRVGVVLSGCKLFFRRFARCA